MRLKPGDKVIYKDQEYSIMSVWDDGENDLTLVPVFSHAEVLFSPVLRRVNSKELTKALELC